MNPNYRALLGGSDIFVHFDFNPSNTPARPEIVPARVFIFPGEFFFHLGSFQVDRVVLLKFRHKKPSLVLRNKIRYEKQNHSENKRALPNAFVATISLLPVRLAFLLCAGDGNLNHHAKFYISLTNLISCNFLFIQSARKTRSSNFHESPSIMSLAYHLVRIMAPNPF